MYRTFTERKTKDAYCPTCNDPLGIKPFEKVAKDANLQAIIDILLPQFAEQEAKERRAFEKKLRSLNMTEDDFINDLKNRKSL